MRFRLTCLIIFGCLFSFLTGCIPSVQLNERAIIQAIGVDAAPDGYQITLQIFAPSGSGDAGIDATQQNAKIIVANGKTISDAIRNATLEQGKQIFYGHNRLLIIGEEIAKQGLDNILPFFNNGYQSRPGTNVMISRSTAEDILTANIKQGIVPAEALQNMIENHTENASVVETTLMNVIQAVYDESRAVAIPAIRRKEDAALPAQAQSGDGEGKMESANLLELDATAILRDSKLVGYLDGDETRGLVWLTGKVERTLVVFSYFAQEDRPAETVSIEIYQSKLHTQLSHQGEFPVFSASISAMGRLNEIPLDSGVLEAKHLERLEEQAAALIRQECLSTFTKAAGDCGADLFSYGKLMMRKDPQRWNRYRENWSEGIKQSRLTVTVDVMIERTGLMSDNRS